MPNTQEYQRFRVEALAGGIRRDLHIEDRQLASWSDSRGFWSDDRVAIVNPGYLTAFPSVLSPEFQYRYAVGAVRAVVNTRSFDGQLRGAVRLERLGDAAAEARRAAQVEWLLDRYPWRFRLEDDHPSTRIAVDGALSTYPILVLAGPYNGRRFGALDNTISNEAARYRLERLDTEQETTCPINLLHSFFYTESNELLVACTPKDVYRYDAATRDLSVRLTPTITKTCLLNDSITFTLLPDLDGVEIGHLFYVEADGPEYAEEIVDLVGAAIKLRAPYTGAGTLGDAVIVQTFASGSAASIREARRNPWRAVTWSHGAPGRRLILVNGIDPVQSYDGSTLVPLDGLVNMPETSTTVEAARDVAVFYETVVLAGTLEDGVWHERRIRWCEPNDCELWQGHKFRDLPASGKEGPDRIVRAVQLGQRLVALCDRSVANVRPVGAPFDFGVDTREGVPGCIAGGSAQAIRNRIVAYLGPDDFYAYDLNRAERIGEPVKDLVFKHLNNDMIGQAVSLVSDTEGVYLCSFPTSPAGDDDNWITVAWDFEEKTWSAPFEGFLGLGRWYRQEKLPINSYTMPINHYQRIPYNRRESAGAPIYLAGCADGHAVELFHGASRDYANRDSYFETGASNLGFAGYKIIGWAVPETDGSGLYTVEIGVGNHPTFLSWSTVGTFAAVPDPLPNMRDFIIPIDVTGKFVAFRFRHTERNRAFGIRNIDVYWRPLGRD